jgi:hypothetical protein
MRSRALIVDVREDSKPSVLPERGDTYDQVRRTLDDALAELELPADSDRDADRTGPVRI